MVREEVLVDMVAKSETNRSHIAWWVLGFVLAMLLALVVYKFIGTFVVGLFVYYISKPVYSRLKQDIKSSGLAAFATLVVVALPILLIIGYTLTIGIQGFGKLIQQYQIETLARYLGPYIEISSLTAPIEQIFSGGIIEAIIGGVEKVTSYIAIIGSLILHMFLALSIAFYLLRDGPGLSKWVVQNFADGEGVFEKYMSSVDRSFHQVFVGNILNVLITAAIGVIVYTFVSVWFGDGYTQLPYPAILGIVAGVASLVPIVGMKIIYIPTTLYLLVQGALAGGPNSFWILPIVFLIVSFVVVDCIPDLIIRPYISGKDLHVGMIMFSYIFGSIIFGWYGIFLGPMICILIFHFGKLVLPEMVSGIARESKNTGSKKKRTGRKKIGL